MSGSMSAWPHGASHGDSAQHEPLSNQSLSNEPLSNEPLSNEPPQSTQAEIQQTNCTAGQHSTKKRASAHAHRPPRCKDILHFTTTRDQIDSSLDPVIHDDAICIQPCFVGHALLINKSIVATFDDPFVALCVGHKMSTNPHMKCISAVESIRHVPELMVDAMWIPDFMWSMYSKYVRFSPAVSSGIEGVHKKDSSTYLVGDVLVKDLHVATLLSAICRKEELSPSEAARFVYSSIM